MNLPLLLIGGAFVGYYMFNKAMNFNTLSKTWDFTYKVKYFTVGWTELKFGIEITVINPSSLAITVTNPFIQVFYENNILTRSTLTVPSMSVKPNSNSVLPVFDFSISTISSLFTLTKMVNKLLGNQTVVNSKNYKEVIEKNKVAFLKLLNVQLTGYINGTPFTQSFPLA